MPIIIDTLKKITDPKIAFIENFKDLASNESDNEYLKQLSEQVVALDFKGENAEFTLNAPSSPGSKAIIKDTIGYKGKIDDSVPPSYAKTVSVHGSLNWELPGGGLYGFSGIDVETGKINNASGWEYEAIEEASDENADFIGELSDVGKEVSDVDGALDYGQNWIVFDPTNVEAGDPFYAFVSHGDCIVQQIKGSKNLKFGSMVIRVMVQSILGEKCFEEVNN
jgi:hypothetical protein